jgi:hypothetical protein
MRESEIDDLVWAKHTGYTDFKHRCNTWLSKLHSSNFSAMETYSKLKSEEHRETHRRLLEIQNIIQDKEALLPLIKHHLDISLYYSYIRILIMIHHTYT